MNTTLRVAEYRMAATRCLYPDMPRDCARDRLLAQAMHSDETDIIRYQGGGRTWPTC
jgi:hypothetical protein